MSNALGYNLYRKTDQTEVPEVPPAQAMECQKEPLNLQMPAAATELHPQLQQRQWSRQQLRRLAKVNEEFQENSMPAIQKLAKSPSCSHRFFWSIVFLATFTGFVIHLVSITLRYMSTPVSTETRVERIDTMPSILICPQNYLSSTRSKVIFDQPNALLRNMTFRNIYNEILPMFWNFVYSIRSDNSSSIDRRMIGMKIKNNFLWYLIHFWKKSGKIQHEKHDVFLHLSVQDAGEITPKDIGTTFDSQRNRCFSWEPEDRVINPLTAILNVPDGRYFYAEQDAFELVSDSGLWLHICFNQSFGCHENIRYFLRTGHYTKIDLRKMVVSQLPVANHSTQESCISGDNLYEIKDEQFDNSSGVLRVAYTSALCNDIQLQHHIYDQCGCLSALLPTETFLYDRAVRSLGSSRDLFCNLPPDEAFTHKQFPRTCRENPLNDTNCMVPPLDNAPENEKPKSFRELLQQPAIRRFLMRDACHDEQFKIRIFQEKCPKVCRREQFSSVHSVVPWPESQLSRSHASTFARIFVNTIRPFLEKAINQQARDKAPSGVLKAVRKAFLDGINFTRASIPKADLKPLYKEGLHYMQQRLLLLEIGYASADMQVMSESESYPLKSFLSDIGGIMGLWIGMSIVSVCEFCLLLWRLLYYLSTRCLR